jgi:GH15 family glucan-1,4-alpha-glucosidase
VFLACNLRLADSYLRVGREEDVHRLFKLLFNLRYDIGLLAEYDPYLRRQVGNFPQAFSHVGLVNTACKLTQGVGPTELHFSATHIDGGLSSAP